jgi:hypothetical protein
MQENIYIYCYKIAKYNLKFVSSQIDNSQLAYILAF